MVIKWFLFSPPSTSQSPAKELEEEKVFSICRGRNPFTFEDVIIWPFYWPEESRSLARAKKQSDRVRRQSLWFVRTYVIIGPIFKLIIIRLRYDVAIKSLRMNKWRERIFCSLFDSMLHESTTIAAVIKTAPLMKIFSCTVNGCNSCETGESFAIFVTLSWALFCFA